MWCRSLNTHFTWACLVKQLSSTREYTFTSNWQLPFLIQQKGRKTTEMISRSISIKVMLSFKLQTPASAVRCATVWLVEPSTLTTCIEYLLRLFFFCFLFYLGFTALSRIFHLYPADSSSKVSENWRNQGKKHLTIRKQNLPFPHVTRARLETQRWET